ncbi:MAG: A24 family peptidase [Gammaproteobacteria bacterium]|nr:A24 family peptidase [Gammaproteobacteria bacterium]
MPYGAREGARPRPGIETIDFSPTPPWTAALLTSLAGLCVGSFLNVVIDRLPIMLRRQWRMHALETLNIEPPPASRFNLATPRSHCPVCGSVVKALHNVPVLSWMVLRGRCAKCGSPIPVRLPAVELAGAALAIAAIALWGFQWIALAYYVFLMVLLASALIDAETTLLPDQLTLPLLWLGLLAATAFEATPTLFDAMAGAVTGYLSLWLVYWAFRLVTRREGMGYGDFKLMAAIGAWLGWQTVPAVILVAAVLGLVYAVVRILRRRATRGTPIPFGPFLAVAATAALFASTRGITFVIVP